MGGSDIAEQGGRGYPIFFSRDLDDLQERPGNFIIKKVEKKKIEYVFHNNELNEYPSFVLVDHITNDK